ncbi:hypothetical protein TNCV_4220481 [Trichonephila clavipes]|nr:hypothetical protein TNCV_4220481 [Trichonephila clavipes]
MEILGFLWIHFSTALRFLEVFTVPFHQLPGRRPSLRSSLKRQIAFDTACRDCGTSCVTCCAVLLEPQLLDIMIVQFRNEKVSNHGSIPITTDCNVVVFIVFEEGFHQPIKRTKQSVFLDVTVFRHTLKD